MKRSDNVSNVSSQSVKNTAAGKTNAITANNHKPQNDKTLSYCGYQLSLIPQS
jgi:hypothetical protein